MRTRRRHSLHAVVFITLAVILLGVGTGTAHALPVEDAYTQPGPFDVVYDKDGDGQDDDCVATETPASPNTLIYPEDLGRDGIDHPVLVWGNGTNFFQPWAPNTTCSYKAFLEHVASWGFVIVAPISGWVGDGTEMLAAVEDLVAANSDPSSVFYGKLDTTEVGAIGHSQGADGAIRATIASDGLITSTLAMAAPDPESEVFPWWWPVAPRPDASQLTHPVFFVRGECDEISTEPGDQAIYNQVPGAAAKATVRPDNPCPPWGDGTGATHTDMTNATGYIVAWLQYTLFDNVIARSAFVGSVPEMVANPGWTNQQTKNLP